MSKVIAVVAAAMLLVVSLAGTAFANADGFPNQGNPDKVNCFVQGGKVECQRIYNNCKPASEKVELGSELLSLEVYRDYQAVSIKSGKKACSFKGETCEVERLGCGDFRVDLLQGISNYVLWTCKLPR